MEPTSLAMLKMEKNFIAVLEKKYPRKPYEQYDLIFLCKRLTQEMEELIDEIDNGTGIENPEAIKSEIADISNILDFMFEVLNQRAGAK